MSIAIATVAPLVSSAEQISVYTSSNLDQELWQGEIITNLSVYSYDPVEDENTVVTYPYVVVMCQDCDLEQDFRKRANREEGELLSVLIFQAGEASTLRERVPSSEIMKRAKDNREERYHFLEAVPAGLDTAGTGLPALCIDFKRFFSIDPSELYRQISPEGGAVRRTRLLSPYKEHLQGRASAYAARIGLPRSHDKG